MAEFAYEALDGSGKTVKGSIDAANEDVIAEKLRDMGFYPLKITEQKGKGGDFDLGQLPGLKQVMHRITFKMVMHFTRQLATLIDAGLPILRSLHVLQDQVESAIFKEKITQMSTDIESGSSLSEAMARHPKQFDSLYVNMVRAGEIGGVLESVLAKVAEFLEKRAALASKIRSAMTYPVVVLLFATVLVSCILIFLMPQFVTMFESMGAEIPWLTAQLISLSNLLVNQFYVPIGIIIGVIFLYKAIMSKPNGRFVVDSLILRMPVFGSLFRKSAVTRFASTLATLITSGVPILQSLDIVRETSGNEVITRAMDDIYNSVKEGESIHEPLKDSGVFPPLVVHMVAIGEETGAIDHMLIKVAEAYQHEVDDTVDALTSILEPILIVCLGTIVGVVVIALYLPLFNIAKAVK